MGKFVVKQVKTGVIFNLKAGNGEVIATSEIYATEAACMPEWHQFDPSQCAGSIGGKG